jgi:DNA-binding CsgD family transcriptional regulator/tetratricopeptide (TPR) repeat protein
VGSARKTDDLARGRDCYRRQAWAEAHRCLSAADQKTPLAEPDLELYAWSAALSGRDDDFLALLERLYQLHADGGDPLRAARWAFWLGFRLGAMREIGRASGWLARAQRLTERTDCVEKGYLLLPTAYRQQGAGDQDGALKTAADAAQIGDRFGDANLSAFARCIQGRVLLEQGHVEPGLALLDEAMVAVTTGSLAPVLTGLIYCSAIASCSELYVMDRAREWTAALARWCDAQPELVPFSGTCLVHRAELMQLGGSWREAIEEARRASERVARRVDWQATANAHYQQGEVHRLRGDFSAAEQAYRRASEVGREAQPGMALLRLAQGRTQDAVSAVRGTLQATKGRLQRARLLPAAVEIALAAGDIDDARRSAGELQQIAGDFGTDVLGAMAAHAQGAVALAEGRPEASLEPLRRAFRIWHEVGAPYIAARLRVLIALACRALGDRDTATLELDLARQVFEQLGAAPDLAALEGPGPSASRSAPQARSATNAFSGSRDPALRAGAASRGAPAGLSPRELEVLRLVAAGKTNKSIAKQLFLSEKTVDRHVSNIFAKTNVGSRAAATAFAYQHGLV